MKRLLLVDDDPLVLRLYQEGLVRRGFRVETAADGIGAIGALRKNKPDLVVLDLMMPRLSGVEVLKFIRSDVQLDGLPVVILSNSYMDELAQRAAASGDGVHRALLKSQCTPSKLLGVIEEILEGKAKSGPVELLAAPVPSSAPEKPSADTPPQPAHPAPEADQRPPAASARPSAEELLERENAENQRKIKARESFLASTIATSAQLRSLFQAFIAARGKPERALRLEEFYRKVHFVTATAGFVECRRAAQMAAVFEALLFVLMENPERLGPSVLHTMAKAMDFFEELLQQAKQEQGDPPLSAKVLVVDDDALTNRLVVMALRQAQLQAESTEDPQVGWQRLQERHYDVVLLDVEMPGLNGYDLCQRMRSLPKYEHTPVIYVTSHSQFEDQAKGLLSGGTDLIGKPVLPMELAAKVVMHLLKSQTSE